MKFTLVAAGLFALCCTLASAECKAEARGWGDSIVWSSYTDGLATAKRENKPVMLFVHKTWCGAWVSPVPLRGNDACWGVN